jgi:hypothetical protein
MLDMDGGVGIDECSWQVQVREIPSRIALNGEKRGRCMTRSEESVAHGQMHEAILIHHTSNEDQCRQTRVFACKERHHLGIGKREQ